MRTEESRPLNVEVLPASLEQKHVLANLLELYARNFSELIDLREPCEGRFKEASCPGSPQQPVFMNLAKTSQDSGAG